MIFEKEVLAFKISDVIELNKNGCGAQNRQQYLYYERKSIVDDLIVIHFDSLGYISKDIEFS